MTGPRVYLLALLFILMAMAAAFAQVPVPSGDGPNCRPVYSLPADVVVMMDGDGDWWVLVRFTSTGKQVVGYVSQRTGKFCGSAEGKINPET